MKFSKYLVSAIAIVTISFSFTSCYYDKEELLYPNSVCDTASVTFSRSVAPILAASCNSCHSGNTPSNGISLDNYTAVKTQVDNNKLINVIKHTTGYAPMPKNGAKLSDCNITIINNWIQSGAPNN